MIKFSKKTVGLTCYKIRLEALYLVSKFGYVFWNKFHSKVWFRKVRKILVKSQEKIKKILVKSQRKICKKSGKL